ncbi:MAG: response regulator [Myxococcales bacterium]
MSHDCHRNSDLATSILLVDDDPAVLDATRAMLDDLGFEVHACLGGAAALEVIKDASVRIDALVSDVVMPGLDGLALTDLIEVLRPGTPTILMSGYPFDGLAAKHRQVAVHFLRKPFRIVELIEALDQACPTR